MVCNSFSNELNARQFVLLHIYKQEMKIDEKT
jgi:hypothetical protein